MYSNFSFPVIRVTSCVTSCTSWQLLRVSVMWRCCWTRTLERNLTRDLSRFLCEICRDSFVFLFVKIYSLGIEVTALFLSSFWCTTLRFLSLRCNISSGGEKIIRFPLFEFVLRVFFAEDFGIRIDEILLKRHFFNMLLLFLRDVWGSVYMEKSCPG